MHEDSVAAEDNQSEAPLQLLAKVTPKSHNGDPEHCRLSEERTPAWNNPQQILGFCTSAPPPELQREPGPYKRQY